MTDLEVRVIACNLVAGDDRCVAGAKGYVQEIRHPRARVIVRSRTGAWVDRWCGLADLRDFRPVTVVSADPAWPAVHRCLPAADWAGWLDARRQA